MQVSRINFNNKINTFGERAKPELKQKDAESVKTDYNKIGIAAACLSGVVITGILMYKKGKTSQAPKARNEEKMNKVLFKNGITTVAGKPYNGDEVLVGATLRFENVRVANMLKMANILFVF